MKIAVLNTHAFISSPSSSEDSDDTCFSESALQKKRETLDELPFYYAPDGKPTALFREQWG